MDSHVEKLHVGVVTRVSGFLDKFTTVLEFIEPEWLHFLENR